jgi:hypothetical protein
MTTTEKTPRVGTKARPMYFRPEEGFTKADIIRWQNDLREAGLPEWTPPRAIGFRQMEEISRLKTENPRVYGVMADAHRLSCVEFAARLPDPVGYIKDLAQKDPDLYGPLKATT